MARQPNCASSEATQCREEDLAKLTRVDTLPQSCSCVRRVSASRGSAAIDGGSSCSWRVVEVTGGDFRSAGQEIGQKLVEATSDLPIQPPLAASWALLHGDLQHDRHMAVSLGDLRPPNPDAVRLIASLATHQRLLR
jgi:hypothetical protein